MTTSDILKKIEKGKDYELLASWNEIPIRVKLRVRWVSVAERMVSFDFLNCPFRVVFSGNTPVYIKLGDVFLSCNIFSNIRDELVLEVDTPVPAPPIAMREFVRVEPTKKEPVFISFCIEEVCLLKAQVADISESGVGVYLSEKDASELIKKLSDMSTSADKLRIPFDLEIELPKEGVVLARGELKNITRKEGEDIVRLGLRMDMKEDQRKKVRQYIMRRQREILEHLKSI